VWKVPAMPKWMWTTTASGPNFSNRPSSSSFFGVKNWWDSSIPQEAQRCYQPLELLTHSRSHTRTRRTKTYIEDVFPMSFNMWQHMSIDSSCTICKSSIWWICLIDLANQIRQRESSYSSLSLFTSCLPNPNPKLSDYDASKTRAPNSLNPNATTIPPLP
jgi:hypothetical protein